MGMQAKIMAMGRFCIEVANCLDYKRDLYPTGDYGVITTPICVNSTALSEQLAKAFGINPWDFSQHYLSHGFEVNLDLLREIVDEEQVEKFLALREARFKFFFLPEG